MRPTPLLLRHFNGTPLLLWHVNLSPLMTNVTIWDQTPSDNDMLTSHYGETDLTVWDSVEAHVQLRVESIGEVDHHLTSDKLNRWFIKWKLNLRKLCKFCLKRCLTLRKVRESWQHHWGRPSFILGPFSAFGSPFEWNLVPQWIQCYGWFGDVDWYDTLFLVPPLSEMWIEVLYGFFCDTCEKLIKAS